MVYRVGSSSTARRCCSPWAATTRPTRWRSGWLTLVGTLAREKAERSSLDRRSRGLSLTYAADVGEDWGGSVRLGLSAARFDEEDTTFLRRRQDWTRSLGLTLSSRKLSWEGYPPVFMLDWSRIDSTVPLYDR